MAGSRRKRREEEVQEVEGYRDRRRKEEGGGLFRWTGRAQGLGERAVKRVGKGCLEIMWSEAAVVREC